MIFWLLLSITKMKFANPSVHFTFEIYKLKIDRFIFVASYELSNRQEDGGYNFQWMHTMPIELCSGKVVLCAPSQDNILSPLVDYQSLPTMEINCEYF